MRILVSGASGLVGKALVPYLEKNGHSVIRLSRKENSDGIFWNPEKNVLKKEDLENFDAVINLSGENIATGRWTKEKKRKIKNSRVQSTALLVKTFLQLKNPPKVFINASAIGYYGTKTDDVVTENSSNGSGFLAEVCKEWEAAAAPAKQLGIRTVFTRFGAVLSNEGGALGAMLIPFKLGLGGKVGSGKQWMSWIAIDDLIHAMNHVLTHQELEGPINFTSPEPVQNEVFTKILGKILQRPTMFPLPRFVAKLILGEMAEELLLTSIKAKPARLLESNYRFIYPNVHDALLHLLKRNHE